MFSDFLLPHLDQVHKVDAFESVRSGSTNYDTCSSSGADVDTNVAELALSKQFGQYREIQIPSSDTSTQDSSQTNAQLPDSSPVLQRLSSVAMVPLASTIVFRVTEFHELYDTCLM